MRVYLNILFLCISVFLQGQSLNNINLHQEDSLINARKAELMNKPLPAFQAAGYDGVINNDSLTGKITFINLWEASCAPCMAEMDALNKLYDTLENYREFQFISLSSDNTEIIKKIKAQYHIGFNMYHLDEEGCFQLNQGGGYPTSIITDKKSNVKYVHFGGYTDSVRIWHFIFYKEIYPEIMKELDSIQVGK